ncbi:MAG: hypothetical protein EOO85_01825 [Pedobacter sp.]|jgi:uncharacterized protein YndB with AHSA1/START domain|nr:MAG: hypothetical protein EOO85_01825 [Pedobacter sp.]
MGNEIINNTDQSDWIKKSIVINASDDKVWFILTNTEDIKKWAVAFDEGTQLISEWTEGATVEWRDANDQKLMKGKVEVSYPAKMLKVGFYEDMNADDTEDLGEYKEHYLLTEEAGKTTFTIESGPLMDEYIEMLSPQWDEALQTIKSLAEAS